MDKKDGWINIDIRKCVSPDMLLDIGKDKFPFDDNSVDRVKAVHVMEHISNLNHTMKEIYRVCADKAEVEIISPYWTHHTAFDDPSHIRFITERTFCFYDPRSLGSDGSSMEEANGFYTNFSITHIDYSFDKCTFEKENIRIILKATKAKV